MGGEGRKNRSAEFAFPLKKLLTFFSTRARNPWSFQNKLNGLNCLRKSINVLRFAQKDCVFVSEHKADTDHNKVNALLALLARPCKCCGLGALGGNLKVGHMWVKITPWNAPMKRKPKATYYIKTLQLSVSVTCICGAVKLPKCKFGI